MVLEFKLPDIGEGVAEGEIIKWLVKPGDVVKEFELIVEVSTDKATVELPSPAPGTVGELLAEPGDVVPVGQVIFTLQTDGAGAPAPAAEEKTLVPAAAPAPVATGGMVSGVGSIFSASTCWV